VSAGCTAVAALSLRCPANSEVLYQAGLPEIILQCMKIHVKDATVQVCYMLPCFIVVLVILPPLLLFPQTHVSNMEVECVAVLLCIQESQI
jgi:hypothetical protein